MLRIYNNNTLPQEILAVMFSCINDPKNLGKCERVCKTWKKVLRDHPEIWKKLLLVIDPTLSNSINPKSDLILSIQKRAKAGHYSCSDILGRGLTELIIRTIEAIPCVGTLFRLTRIYRNSS